MSEIQNFVDCRIIFVRYCLAMVLILSFVQSAIQGFSSLTLSDARQALFKKPATGFVHGELTRKTMCALNLRNDIVLKVVDINWRIDWDSNSRDFQAYVFGPARRVYRPNKKYEPEFHFDRNKEDQITINGRKFPDHNKPFVRGVVYLQDRRKVIVDGLIGRNGKTLADAQTAMGQALHAMQDFFSHSNVTDLPEAEYNQVIRSLDLVSGLVGPRPLSLKIGGFDKNINADFEKPELLCSKSPFQPYGHDACAKDSEEYREAKREMERDAFKYVAGKTKFVRAKEAAIEFSLKWLQAVKAEVGAVSWKKIEDDGTSPCQVNVAFNPAEKEFAEDDVFSDSSEFEAIKHGNWLVDQEFSPFIFEPR